MIYNGLHSRMVAPQPYVSPNRRRFGFLGRCDYRKGLREAIGAFTSVEGELVIACGDEDPDYRDAAKADIRRYEMDRRVQWVGRLEDDGEKAAFFRSLDALIVPSRWEPFGYVVLEALRAGFPPLIGSRGGTQEIVGESYRYQFDPWDRESIVNCLVTFEKDSVETVMEEMIRAIRHSEALTAEKMAEEYRKLAHAVLQKPSCQGAVRKRRYSPEGLVVPRVYDGGNASATPRLPFGEKNKGE